MSTSVKNFCGLFPKHVPSEELVTDTVIEFCRVSECVGEV